MQGQIRCPNCDTLLDIQDPALTSRQRYIRYILNELNCETGQPVRTIDLAELVGVSLRTIQYDLAVLESMAEVHRPNGKKSGWVIDSFQQIWEIDWERWEAIVDNYIVILPKNNPGEYTDFDQLKRSAMVTATIDLWEEHQSRTGEEAQELFNEATQRRIFTNGAKTVYFIQGISGGPIKIGYTSLSVESRIASLQYHEELCVLATLEGDQTTERDLHEQFAAERRYGEWFEPSDRLLAFIESLGKE